MLGVVFCQHGVAAARACTRWGLQGGEDWVVGVDGGGVGLRVLRMRERAESVAGT